MIRMDCAEVRDLLAPYADGELPEGERGAIGLHLASCPECAAALGEIEVLSATLRRAGTFALPDGLEERLRLAAKREGEARPAPLWPRYAALAASHLAVAALAAALAIGWHSGEALRTQAVGEVVSAHVRSTLAESPVQVASADTHTVRPWFTGKLAFAPPVRDLSDAGFPLAGGRLDHVLGSPAAALVYGRRKHRLNLFILPKDETGGADLSAGRAGFGPAGGVNQLTRNGFNIAAWSDPAFTYVAISDLNGAELAEFAALFRTQAR